MYNPNEFEIEIKKMRLEYDISAISTQIIDEKRKMLEVKKQQAVIQTKIQELDGKLQEKKQELETLG